MAEILLIAAVRISGRWVRAPFVDMRGGGFMMLLVAEMHETDMFMASPEYYDRVALEHPSRIVTMTPAAVVATSHFAYVGGWWTREQQIVPPIRNSWQCYVTVPPSAVAATAGFDNDIVRSSRLWVAHTCNAPDCTAPTHAGHVCAAHAWSYGVYE
jgi:hypothetical protein